MKISHIVTNGCSFTHGAGLKNPFTQSWPCVLGQKMGVDCVNIARSGSGNDRIFRRTYEYFYEDIKNDNNPLYIIMFSCISRQDRWLEDAQKYDVISPIDHAVDPVAKDFIHNYNKVNFYRHYMLYRMALKNLFEAHNIPYIFYLGLELLGDYDEKKKMDLDMSNLLSNQYDIFKNDEHYGGDASVIAAGYPTLPCGHWGIEANIKLADHVHDKIKSLYKNIEIEPTKNYLTNNKFIKLTEPYYTDHYNDLSPG